MNQKRVNDWIPRAKEAILVCGISEDGKTVAKTYRGQISSFGAAVVTGSLKLAVAVFSKNGDASVERTRLLQAVYTVISGERTEPEEIFRYVCANDGKDTKEQFIDAVVAVKAAINYFELTNMQKSSGR